MIQNYTYFAPDLTEDGDLRYEVTIRGTWPQYTYRPVPAVFYGADGHIDIAPEFWLGVRLQAALVRAHDLSTGDFLIGTPPDHGRIALIGRLPEFPSIGDIEFSVHSDLIAKQTHTNPQADFAPAPDGAVLLGAMASATIPARFGEFKLSLEARNLLNTRYREYTSLLRYYADQPGRDVRLRVGLTF